MGEREQIMNFLLQSCDAKTKVITELQEEIKSLKAQLPTPPTDAK